MSEEKLKDHRLNLSNACMQLPIRSRAVLYVSRGITEPLDNTALLLQELSESPAGKGLIHIIAVQRFDEAYLGFKERFKGIDLRFVIYDSDEFIKAAATSKYIISDGSLPLWFIKREKQVLLCLPDHRGLLYEPDDAGKAQRQIYSEINRLIPQANFLLCPGAALYGRLNEKLFISGCFKGRLIHAAEPAFYEGAGEGEYYDACREAPDREAAFENITAALFYGEGSFFEYSVSGKPKIAVIAYLQLYTRHALALRNLCNAIDKSRYDVTVLAYATNTALLFAGFNEGTRIIMREGYTVNEKEMEAQLSEADSLEERDIWKYEILRSLGSDDFDEVLVYNTVNQFRHRFAGYMDCSRRIYATPSEEELLKGSQDKDGLVELINGTYDKVLLLNGEGERLLRWERMPIVYSSLYGQLLADHTPTPVYTNGTGNYIAITPSPTPPIGCKLAPAPDPDCINIFAVVSNRTDAEKLKIQFEQYREDRPSARLYLDILTGTPKDAEDLTDEYCIAIAERKLPVILLALCDRFVYPYEGGSGLNIAAAIFGTAAQPQDHTAGELLLLAGPETKTLLSGYAAELPKSRFYADTSSFEPPAAEKDMLKKYEQQIYHTVNNEIFSFERQEQE